MKTWKRLLAALLAVTMICAMAACTGKKGSAGKDVTVTFYNGDQVYKTVTVKTGEKLTLPEAPKAEKGLGLAGWSTIDGDIEEIIDPATYVVRGDLSLYAVWADVFTVTINADNGTPFEVVEVLAGSLMEKPADPEKEGFRFVEWRDALQDITFDFSKPIYDDVILKAMYGDGSANRVSDTKWDFSGGIHGAWTGGQGGWKYQVDGMSVEDMVYETTEDGYAAWGFTLTDDLENIPVIDGKNGKGLGMKYIYNEGINVEASKAKLVVIYLKPKYFPIDMATSPEDQFRISVLTNKGGMIYGYGDGSEAWALRTDGTSANLIQVDQMEDGWIRVQFKIHELSVWSEDAIVKSMSISFVQRKSTPVMDVISVKSIELLDQEEFIDPRDVDYVTKVEWDMSNIKDAEDWTAYHAKKKLEALTTAVTDAGKAITYLNPGNGWKGIVLENALVDISKLTGELSFTYRSNLPITSYRIHVATDLGGNLTSNGTAECYTAVSVSDIEAGKLPAWTKKVNADGSVTVTFDLNSMAYFADGEELRGLTIVTVTANKIPGTVTYKSIELETDLSGHDCEEEGHFLKPASCTAPATCYACGATEGEAEAHTWKAATCSTPKTCQVCKVTEGTALGHNWKEATCTDPKTCSRCYTTTGQAKGHKWVDGICSVCGEYQVEEVRGLTWDMSKEEQAAQWTSVQSKTVTNTSTKTVTENGSEIEYTHQNAWKGITLKDLDMDISKLSGKLYITYSSQMSITHYRIYVLTDLGGSLSHNDAPSSGFDPDNYYAAIKLDAVAGSEYWTATENADGTITVCVDLNSLPFFAEGKTLKGLAFVTVTNNAPGKILYKSIELTGEVKVVDKIKCETEGHQYGEADCTTPGICTVCGAVEGSARGHDWKDATCLAPKTCSACGATEGELGNHADTNSDSKCDACGADCCAVHTWTDATCLASKTCSVCGMTEGGKAAHADEDKNLTCDVCGDDMVVWNMNNEADAASWAAYHAKKKNEALTATVTEDGLKVVFDNPGNGWKGLVLENAATDIGKLSGKLTFTYSTDIAITSYRIHILTDLGGDLTANGTADCYANVKIADITAGKLPAWTQTTNADGSVTVTFDLSSMAYFADGATLSGLTIVTVTNNSTPGAVTYKYVELEKRDCDVHGHAWTDATCTDPKTCSACGITEGEADGHVWLENVCVKTCELCGATEGDTAHTFVGGVCSVCGVNAWDTDSDGILEILAIGNSFSTDAMEYTWQIAKALGIEEVVVGNLYIGGCTLNEHYTNASGDLPNYRYYYCDNGTWTSTENYTLSTALESRSWDYVSLQQASPDSGVESTYNADLTNLIAYVKAHSNAKLIWHMTWAYQQNSTHSAFPTYGSDQMTMYNAIVSAVKNKIVTNGNFALIVPNGTAVQNARTSLVGDTLTRDGYHMSKDYGRYLTGLMLIKTVTGLDISGIEYAPDGVSDQYREIAIESVNNAYAHPFEVTQSAYQSAEAEDFRTSWDMSKEEDAADWAGYHAKKKNESLTTTVTDAGMDIAYGGAGNGWKAIVLEGATIDISKLTGKLTFTYSSDMAITSYRIHILTNLGGNLTSNGTADYYVAAKISDITAGNLEGWTQTSNADGSVTVTYDLSAMSYFAGGTELRGLTIVTVTENKTTGSVIYKSIELEAATQEDNCQQNGHTWTDATCTAPKTCSVCGATEGEVGDHSYVEGVCSVCGAAEEIPSVSVVWDMSNAADSAQWISLQNKTVTNKSTITVTEAGSVVQYNHTNAWKGIRMQDASIVIGENTRYLTFTYSPELTVSNYRVYVLTDKGGNLAENSLTDKDSYYVDIKLSDIAASAAWTSTTNADGSITVTFDLTTLPYYQEGAELKGLTIVTVASGTGSVTYKNISLSATADAPQEEACQHSWTDATCAAPKTCGLCGATEGEALGHSWTDATCTAPKTCSVCGATEGEVGDHSYVEGVCSVCGAAEIVAPAPIVWNMSTEADASQWQNAQAYTSTKPSVTTAEVTADGFKVTYLHKNGWKGIVLKNVEHSITGLSVLSFTYIEEMDITNYRIHVLTDLGGDLESNTSGTPANYYASVAVSDIAASSAWTRTENTDGTVTVTFDLTTLPFFKEGKKLLGMDIVTVTATGTTGTVTYKKISVATTADIPQEEPCQHTWTDATCTAPKTCSVCGATEGEALGHSWTDATCTAPKTCSVCGATEGEALGHSWTDATCTAPKTCSVCGATEGEALGHSWTDATCAAPKTCSACGTTEGTVGDHTYVEGVCDLCGAVESIPATPVVWNMSNAAAASQWQNAQAYTSTKPSVTTAEVTADGFKVTYLHKNGWKGIVLKNVEIGITGLSVLSFTYIEEMDITNYRIHVLTDLGGDLGSNTSGTPSDYYASISLGDIAQSSAWTRTVNGDGSITVTFDLTTLPFFKEGTKLLGMDIVTVTATGTTGTVTYKTIEIR